MAELVTVAIPVLNGGALLAEALSAVVGQEFDGRIELLVADSGSTDGSPDLARSFGATVLQVERFSHGGTRNTLMERAAGARVAFLTQDAVPADKRWLSRLMSGFELSEDVALVCGPYRPRSEAPLAVRRELETWFASLAPDGLPRVDRTRTPSGPSAATFFTDANAAIDREVWSHVRFPTVPYAEDQALARDMLRAGYAKAFIPDAEVVHSHDYAVMAQFRRSFDEWRGLREVHGFVQPAAPVRTALAIRREIRADVRDLRGRRVPPAQAIRESVRSFRHWTVRALGAALGSRADRLPPSVRAWCSLERRPSFEPTHEPQDR